MAAGPQTDVDVSYILTAGRQIDIFICSPDRPAVTRIRQRDAHNVRPVFAAPPTPPMAGFEPQFTDIVDYTVRTADKIGGGRAVGRIYDTHDAGCTFFSPYGILRSVEEAVEPTMLTLHAFSDTEVLHLNIAWSVYDAADFTTCHLGRAQVTNLETSSFAPPTRLRTGVRFCADSVIRENRMNTPWLVRATCALVSQLGLNLHDTARHIALQPAHDLPVVSVASRLDGQSPRQFYDMLNDTPRAWALHHFGQIWNARRFDHVPIDYARDAIVHRPVGRTANGQYTPASQWHRRFSPAPPTPARFEAS